MKEPKKTMPAADAETPSNLFQDLMAKHRRGFASGVASDKLREALVASRETGAKSTVTLVVTITPGVDDQCTIAIQATNKLPQEKLPGGTFWVADDGGLLTSDPRQKEFAIREVIPVGVRAVAEAAEAAARVAKQA
jgi:hypothetical protein